MAQLDRLKKRLFSCVGDTVLPYWALAVSTMLVSCTLSEWFSLSSGATIGAWLVLPILLAIAILVWGCHLARLPMAGSIFLRRGLPPPVIWVMLASGTVALFTALYFHHIGSSSDISTAFVAAALALIGYTLLLPRVLACQTTSRLRTELQAAVGDTAASASKTRSESAAAAKEPDRIPPINNGPTPWGAPINDPEREQRLFRWIAVPENPIGRSTDDLFDVKQKAVRLLELLCPVSPVSNAGTVNVLGPRGSGKSSLLRLAAEFEQTSKAKLISAPQVVLRFCFLSLWDYSNPRAALRGAIDELLEIIRDRIDILPIAGISNGIVRAFFGASAIPDILGGFSAPSLDHWLPALSELLVRANLRIILCVEDDDRITTAARRADHCEIMQGFLDRLKGLPGFGYVICTSTPVWSEPSPDEFHSVIPEGGNDNADNWNSYNERWLKACRDGVIKTENAPPLTAAEMARLRGEVGGIIYRGRSKWAESMGHLPVSRLCQYDCLLDEYLRYAEVEPVLKVFRTWMVRQVWPDLQDLTMAVPLCGIDTQQRQSLFSAFLADYSDSGLAQHITPRTLRNALREAHRRWMNIVAVLQQDRSQDSSDWQKRWTENGIDFDSVLTACLLRACLPDRWPNFLRGAGNQTLYTSFHRNLAEQRPGGPEGFSMLHGEVATQLRNLPLWLGLSSSVWNVLAVQDFVQGHNVRPGGIIGNGAQNNWKLFINS